MFEFFKTLKNRLDKLDSRVTTATLEKTKKLLKLNEEDFDTVSPYGKHVQGGSEVVNVKVDADLNIEQFEKGTLFTLSIGNKLILSKFVRKV